jgi:hypothetical protein
MTHTAVAMTAMINDETILDRMKLLIIDQLSFTVPSAEGKNDLIITIVIGTITKSTVNKIKGVNNAQRFDL